MARNTRRDTDVDNAAFGGDFDDAAAIRSLLGGASEVYAGDRRRPVEHPLDNQKLGGGIVYKGLGDLIKQHS